MCFYNCAAFDKKCFGVSIPNKLILVLAVNCLSDDSNPVYCSEFPFRFFLNRLLGYPYQVAETECKE